MVDAYLKRLRVTVVGCALLLAFAGCADSVIVNQDLPRAVGVDNQAFPKQLPTSPRPGHRSITIDSRPPLGAKMPTTLL